MVLALRSFMRSSGLEGTRTPYLVNANDALYQMSYEPIMLIISNGVNRQGHFNTSKPFWK